MFRASRIAERRAFIASHLYNLNGLRSGVAFIPSKSFAFRATLSCEYKLSRMDDFKCPTEDVIQSTADQVSYCIDQIERGLSDNSRVHRMFNKLLSDTIYLKQTTLTEKLLECFHSNSLKLNVHIATTVVKYYTLQNDIKMALAVLEQTRGVYPPNMITCSALLTAAARSDLPHVYVFQALSLLRSLGCKPASTSLTQAFIEWIDKHLSEIESYGNANKKNPTSRSKNYQIENPNSVRDCKLHIDLPEHLKVKILFEN